MTSLSPLHVERAGAVTVLTLNRPDVLNAFNEALTEALNAAIADCAADPSVRAVVITGAGRAFSAGQDLDDRLAMIEKGGELHLGDELRRRYHPAIAAIRGMRKPVVAAVNGVAAGAALGLAIACDVRVAATSATFRAAWGRVGLVPDAGSAFFLPRLIGWGRALDMTLSGNQFLSKTLTVRPEITTEYSATYYCIIDPSIKTTATATQRPRRGLAMHSSSWRR